MLTDVSWGISRIDEVTISYHLLPYWSPIALSTTAIQVSTVTDNIIYTHTHKYVDSHMMCIMLTSVISVTQVETLQLTFSSLKTLFQRINKLKISIAYFQYLCAKSYNNQTIRDNSTNFIHYDLIRVILPNHRIIFVIWIGWIKFLRKIRYKGIHLVGFHTMS